MVFGQLTVQCNSQLADETTQQSHQEIKVQPTIVRFMKSKEHRERYLSKINKTNNIRYLPLIVQEFLQKGHSLKYN